MRDPYLLTPPYARSDFTPEDMAYMDAFCSGSDKMEIPLRLALFISPIYLLVPKLLHKMKGRIDIFEVMDVSFTFRPSGFLSPLSFIKGRPSFGEQETSPSPTY